MIDHTFVICAYGESPYLETCIRSVMNQTLFSQVIMVTSTENEHIRRMAYTYGIPLMVHQNGGLGRDWNFGMSCATTGYVTLVHQDDVYTRHYLERIMARFVENGRGLIAFSDYGEIRDGRFVRPNRNMKIKKLLLKPLTVAPENPQVRRRVLSLGNPICCPAVTYNRHLTGDIVFDETMKTNSDWKLWESLSRMEGAFLYIPEILVGHRIHGDSATSDTIATQVRRQEDLEMLSAFWPDWMAKGIGKLYRKGEAGNNQLE